MKISGAGIIRNGVKLGFPFIESIKSILPICDQFVVAVGDSDDGTRLKLEALNNPKILLVDTIWDKTKREGGHVLSEQTNIALSHCANEYIFYIQSDEVVNECDFELILRALNYIDTKPHIDALAFKYLHFYGDYSTIQQGRNWYPSEVRIIKNNRGILSYGDAQGFRKAGRKINAFLSEARMYHYGWARPPGVMLEKIKSFHSLWHDDKWIKANCSSDEFKSYFNDLGNLAEFNGKHPAVMSELINKNDGPSFIRSLRQEYLKERSFFRMLKDFSRKLPVGGHLSYKGS